MISPLADIRNALARRGTFAAEGDHLRVSGIEQCARRISLLRHHAPSNPTSWQSSYNMEQGNWAEAGMLPLLEYAGWTLRDQQRELQWPKDVPREDAILIGHIDGIIMHPAAPKDALWENKFLGGYGYKKIVESGLQWGNPAYYSQAQLYMYMLREDGEDIDFAVFHAAVKDPAAIFENRGKEPGEPGYLDPMYEEVVEYDEPHALKTLARAATLYPRLKAGEILWYERQPGDWDCSPRFCPVYDICQPELEFGPAPKKGKKR